MHAGRAGRPARHGPGAFRRLAPYEAVSGGAAISAVRLPDLPVRTVPGPAEAWPANACRRPRTAPVEEVIRDGSTAIWSTLSTPKRWRAICGAPRIRRPVRRSRAPAHRGREVRPEADQSAGASRAIGRPAGSSRRWWRCCVRRGAPTALSARDRRGPAGTGGRCRVVTAPATPAIDRSLILTRGWVTLEPGVTLCPDRRRRGREPRRPAAAGGACRGAAFRRYVEIVDDTGGAARGPRRPRLVRQVGQRRRGAGHRSSGGRARRRRSN